MSPVPSADADAGPLASSHAALSTPGPEHVRSTYQFIYPVRPCKYVFSVEQFINEILSCPAFLFSTDAYKIEGQKL